MRIQLLSDIHFEFQKDQGKKFIRKLDPEYVDVLVIAGDMISRGHVEESLTAFCSKYPHVVYVLGNHEYWAGSEDNWDTVHTHLAEQIDSAKKHNKNLHVLEREVAVIDGKRFVGCTLWFGDEESQEHRAAMRRVGNIWADYTAIPGFSEWHPEKSRLDKEFLEQNVQKGDIVITHFLPSYRSVSKRFTGEPANVFFVRDITKIIAEQEPALIMHGHTHDSCDYKLLETRIVCNPFGYAGYELNKNFKAKYIIEV